MRKLTDWLNSYLLFTDNSEPPELFKLWTGISVLAAALERKCHMTWEKAIYPNLYIVIIGPSGEARKGTAVGPGLELLEELGVELSADAVTREALIRRMKNCNVVVADLETETPIMHSSITVWSPELMVFIGRNDDEFVSNLADWYDCKKKWTYETKNKGIDDIQGVWVNLIGATTPSLLGNSLAKTAIGGGLLSRMILVYGDDTMCKIVEDPRQTQQEKDLGVDLLTDLVEINQLSGPFELSDEYLYWYKNWYRAFRKAGNTLDAVLAPYTSRRSTHLRKISMTLSAARSSDMILSVDDIVKADEILLRTEKLMHYGFQNVGRREIAEFIQSVQTYIAMEGKVTSKQLLARFYRDLSKDELKDVLMTLHARNLIELKPGDVEGEKITVITYTAERSNLQEY